MSQATLEDAPGRVQEDEPFRAQQIERWQKELEKYLREVEAEISILSDAKEACERALEAKVPAW